MRRAPPAVLTVAGLDPTAGAGAAADALRIAREGAHPLVVVSALTVQDTRGVGAVRPVDATVVRAQIAALAADLPIAAAKTGLLPAAPHVRAVARALPERVPLVVDPVLASSGGVRFLDRRGVGALLHMLIPRALLVTPNLPELAALTGRPVGSLEDRVAAARWLLAHGCGAVLVKGGHAPGPGVIDLLVGRASVHVFRSRRLRRSAHGTGCALAAVLAARLALGDGLHDAVARSLARVRVDLARAVSPGRGRPLLGL